jgi:hypothetical protein
MRDAYGTTWYTDGRGGESAPPWIEERRGVSRILASEVQP